MDNCNSKLLSKVETEHLYDVHIEDEYDNDINCCECCDPDYDECWGCSNFMNHDDDSCEIDEKDCHGFTASKSDDDGYHSISFYSTERVDHDDMMDLLRIFGL